MMNEALARAGFT